MLKQNLSYQTALQTLRTIDQYTAADFDTLGISEQDFLLVSGPAVWQRNHIPVVLRTLNALLFGTLEVMAMPKITVPTEFVAAIVASFVHPANRQIACIWLATERLAGFAAAELASKAQLGEIEPVSYDQLFALTLLLSDTQESTAARQAFQRRMNLAFNQAMEIPQ
jgi:hypothetical protein